MTLDRTKPTIRPKARRCSTSREEAIYQSLAKMSRLIALRHKIQTTQNSDQRRKTLPRHGAEHRRIQQ